MSNPNFTNIHELDDILYENWDKLYSVERYLNSAGKARMEAFQSLIWLINFMDDLKDFYESEELRDLTTVKGKHREYYKTIKTVTTAVGKVVGGK